MLGLRALILIMPPPDRAEALLSDDVSDVRRRLSVAYIGPKSRTERPMKSKIGPEVAHVTCDSEHHFQGQKVKGQLAGGGGILLRPRAQLVRLWYILPAYLQNTAFDAHGWMRMHGGI